MPEVLHLTKIFSIPMTIREANHSDIAPSHKGKRSFVAGRSANKRSQNVARGFLSYMVGGEQQVFLRLEISLVNRRLFVRKRGGISEDL